jgi:hypothetical protein
MAEEHSLLPGITSVLFQPSEHGLPLFVDTLFRNLPKVLLRLRFWQVGANGTPFTKCARPTHRGHLPLPRASSRLRSLRSRSSGSRSLRSRRSIMALKSSKTAMRSRVPITTMRRPPPRPLPGEAYPPDLLFRPEGRPANPIAETQLTQKSASSMIGCARQDVSRLEVLHGSHPPSPGEAIRRAHSATYCSTPRGGSAPQRLVRIGCTTMNAGTTAGAQPLRQASAATEQNRLRLLGDLGKRARKEPKPRGRRPCELQDGTPPDHRRHGCRVETTSTHMPLLHIPLLHSESRRRLLGASGFAFSQRAPREGDRHVPA